MSEYVLLVINNIISFIQPSHHHSFKNAVPRGMKGASQNEPNNGLAFQMSCSTGSLVKASDQCVQGHRFDFVCGPISFNTMFMTR